MGFSRPTDEYTDGVDTFLDFVLNKSSSRGEILCPYKNVTTYYDNGVKRYANM